MSSTHLFGGFILAGILLFYSVGANPVAAQCTTCATPAVTYAQAYTAAYAPAPVVYQTYRPTTGWYPGALLDRWRINRWSARTAPTTYTAGYAPTYATAYTAAYTPTYPPSYYATAYRPAYPLSYSVGYAPTVAYSPVSVCATCGSDPCGCSSRPVVMRAIGDGCSTCSVCDSGYVGQATYETPGCAGCASGSSSTYIVPDNSTPAGASGQTGQPTIAPTEQVPERRVQKPEETSVLDSESTQEPDPVNDAEASEPATLLQPPQLFDPSDQVTKRPNSPNVPVWTAVYHSRGTASHISSRPISQSQAARPTAAEAQRDAQGWASAGK